MEFYELGQAYSFTPRYLWQCDTGIRQNVPLLCVLNRLLFGFGCAARGASRHEALASREFEATREA